MSDQGQPSAWCLVANVRRDAHVEGSGGADIRAGMLGTKNFAPGAKVYLFPPRWGDGGERVECLARHRAGGKRLIRVVAATRHLVDFRARQVYEPFVAREMEGQWSEAEAGWWAGTFNARCKPDGEPTP